MIKTLIVEDELNNRNALVKMLTLAHPKIQIVGHANSIESACLFLKTQTIDLLFLDIGLEDGSGFDILDKTSHKSYKVIFTTAYSHNAHKAFQYNTYDYLLKPIDPFALERSLQKVYQHIDQEQTLKDLLKKNKEESNQRLAIKNKGGVYYLPIKDLIRLEANGAYTKIVTTEDTFLSSKNIGYYEKLLDADFVRVHRSHLISLKHICNYKNHYVFMPNTDPIPVAIRKQSLLGAFINKTLLIKEKEALPLKPNH